MGIHGGRGGSKRTEQSCHGPHTDGTTDSLTPQLMIYYFQVCGVQPGKVLELRTTLGLMRARALLDQQLEMERQLAEEEKLRGGGGEDRRLTTSGRLKHGR